MTTAAGRGRTQQEIAGLIDRFDRHPDGYLHARVVIEGKRYYFSRQFGSWLAPGHFNGHSVLKEPEALLGSTLGGEVKYELSRRSRPFDDAVRKVREETEEQAAREAARQAAEKEAPDA